MIPLVIIYSVGAVALIIGAGAFFGAPYVPTRRRDIKRLFDQAYPLQSSDTVLDFGSGDGLVLREVISRGAKGIGYEINPFFYLISRLSLRHLPRATIRLVNAWTTPFPKGVTVVYIFSVGRDGRRLERKMQREVNRIGKPIILICYGNSLPSVKTLQTFEAFFLYEFRPLHPVEA